jgi:hypothetical protein
MNPGNESAREKTNFFPFFQTDLIASAPGQIASHRPDPSAHENESG